MDWTNYFTAVHRLVPISVVAHFIGTSQCQNIVIGFSKFHSNIENGISVVNWDSGENDIPTQLVIFNCSFAKNLKRGIRGYDQSNVKLRIKNSIFYRNSEYGIHFKRRLPYQFTANIHISDSEFIETNTGINADIDCVYRRCTTYEQIQLIFLNNVFKNLTTAIDVHYNMYAMSKETDIKIEYNTFVKNSHDIRVSLETNGPFTGFVVNNLFQESRLPVYIKSWNLKNNVSIRENDFKTCLSKYVEDKFIDIIDITAHIINNSFEHCRLSTGISLNHGTGHLFAFNSFINTTVSACYISIGQSYIDNEELNLDYNYWGTTNIEQVKDYICDYFLDSTKAITKLDIFFKNEAMESTSDSYDVNAYRSVTDIANNVTYIGGIMDSSMDLSEFKGHEFVINRSLIVLKDVEATFADIRITVKRHRGITVYGILTMGKLDDELSNTELKLDGKMSNVNYWNGISLKSGHVNVYSMMLHDGMNRFLEIGGAGPTIVIINCSTVTGNIENFIDGETKNGTFSLIIEDSYITASRPLQLTATNSHVNITITGSSLNSKDYEIIKVKESKSFNNVTTHLYISRSSFSSSGRRVWGLNFEGCSSHLKSVIKDSTFSSTHYSYRQSIFKYLSMEFTAINNTFGNAKVFLEFAFCGESPANITKEINLIGNNLKRPLKDGTDVVINQPNVKQQSHTFNIVSNNFDGQQATSRNGIKCNSWRGGSPHLINIGSNVFQNYDTIAVDLDCRHQIVIIENNTFQSNYQCIAIQGVLTEGLDISGNTFVNNTNQAGIIFLGSSKLGYLTCNITENIFVDNNGTVIALRWQNVRLKYNIFENEYAFYNVKVLPDVFGDFEESINATLNFWGSSDTRDISKGIYDFNFDNELLTVLFRPYLASKNVSDIQNVETGFISKNGEIGGKVGGNITLNENGSPYLVVSNIYVEEQDVLTIQAGIRLNFRQGVGIYVKGRLVVVGKLEHPVLFLPEKKDLPWRGIEIDSSQGCVISNLVVNETEQGITITHPSFDVSNLTSIFSQTSGLTLIIPKDHENETTINFSHLKLKYNQENGLFITVSKKEDVGSENNQNFNLFIRNSTISRNEKNGIKMFSFYRIEIFNCDISENSESGIDISQHSGMINIISSYITSNVKYAIKGGITAVITIDFCEIKNHTYEYFNYRGRHTNGFIELKRARKYSNITSYISIRNNRFEMNTADGITISNKDGPKGILEINFSNNVFTFGHRPVVCEAYSYSYGTLKFKLFFQNNTLNNNSLLYENYLIDVKISDSTSYYIEMKDNFVSSNQAESFLAFYSNKINGAIKITGNIFQQNTFTSSLIYCGVTKSLQIHQNIFESSNTYSCLAEVPDFITDFEVNATHNYWGTRLAQDIFEKICGFEKDMRKSFVRLFPYYMDKELTLLSGSGYNVNGIIGGEVTKDTMISRREYNSTFEIHRSLLIREGVKLTIEQGVSLIFAPNRGIYVQGSLAINGQNLDIVLDSHEVDFPWYGIVVNISSNARTEKVQISGAKIQNTLYGIVSYTPSIDIKRAVITNSSKGCLTLSEANTHSVYDFDNTIFKSCWENGIQIKGVGAYNISNAYIHDSLIGIETGMFSGSFEVHSCFITNCSVGISVESQVYAVNNSISIIKNRFIQISSKALVLKFGNTKLLVNDKDRKIKVDLNTFKDVCGIVIQTWNHVMSSFRDNDLLDSRCISQTDCFMEVLSIGSPTFDHLRLFDISSNRFENITARCVIQLEDNKEVNIQNIFTYNTVRDNKGMDGVILVNSKSFNISGNILDNPDSVFDIITTTKGTYSVNITKNWWGSVDISHIYSRIFDKRRIPDLIRFEIEPVLLSSFFDCENVNNCSSHGECVSPNRCRCSSGWAGQACESFDCSDIHNCYGNGECTGSNTCSCYDDWYGEHCITASCSQVNNCSGHGFCSKPNTCTCAVRYTGSDCSSCKPNFGGPSCQPCPECKHGTCSSLTGLCECDDTSWAGYLCDRCNDTFYGPDCLPLMKILEIVPSRGQEKGGTDVHVWGHNFPETVNDSYKCRFGKTQSAGKWLARNHVVCIAPRLPEGEVTLEISPNGTEFTNDQLTYFYYSTCPPAFCGRDINPPRGQCVFGSCSCYLPWKGDNCTVKIQPLLIKDVPHLQTVNESKTYNLQLEVEQGDLPVRWFLSNGPLGMTIDQKTGLLRWPNTKANIRLYHIEVKASNIISEASVTWSLMVPLSYTVTVEYIEPSAAIFPVPRTIIIVGNVEFVQRNSSRRVPVEVIVLNQKTKRETVIDVESSSISPDTFTAIYYPRPDDAGLFSVIAKHPGNMLKSMIHNITWSVLGLKCEPSEVVIDKIISPDENTVSIMNVSALINVGNSYITDIAGEVDGLPGAILRKAGDFNNTNNPKFFIQTFGVNETVLFDLIITNVRPLYEHIYIHFISSEGTYTGINVNIKLSVKKPVLVLKPSFIRESIVRGSIKVIDINITNIGEVSATNVFVSLPGDSRMSLVSFGADDYSLTNLTNTNVDILPTGSARLSISVIIQENEALGEMRGTIYINSASASYDLPYTIVITSSKTMNVTFVVKDEYTYFANGSPLVSNARIKLRNPRREFSEEKYTDNETGVVVFEEIYEDRYTIHVEAESHSSYANVILISPEKVKYDIFLPRIAVRYTWTVESTAIKDVYIIDLESTFETYVPMPVVTVKPSYIDTLPLVMGETSTIELTLTNHGLIRADNVRFSLPTSHPYLSFTSMIDVIGSIAANSSIVVPVQTMLKHREKRSSDSFCVDILLLYSFQCAGTQTRSALVRLTHGNAQRSCSGLFYSHDRLSGRHGRHGSGFAVGYVSGTALTCDCFTTIFKSCVLAFIPGFGCPLAVFNFVTADHTSLSFKDEILGVMDIMFGCVHEGVLDDIKKAYPENVLIHFAKKNLPVIKNLYTAVRCVQDVKSKCFGGRKRREINSNILAALTKVCSTILNFINMGKEILGNQTIVLTETWYREFKRSVGHETQLGVMISETESSAILDALMGEEYRKNLSTFIGRYNNTAASLENGTLSQLEPSGNVISLKRLNHHVNMFLSDNEQSKGRGYNSIFEEFEYLVKTYYDSKEKESSSLSRRKDGVCARVRIKIEQKLVLTRDAFKAKLEIENGEKSDLENIKVEIQIKPTFGSDDIENDKFSIGKLTLIGISRVDGKGSLGRDLSGSAEWLIIPYSNAAPRDDTQYDVGGQLSYSVDGTEFSVPLLPDTIVVSPNPSLIVHYFHEKYVQGDDALTPEIEPVVPFTLAVMVMNSGYGVARALKITSGQPEIIENKKGLLVSFKIIGATLGNKNIAPSLTVDFEDIPSFETKTAKWFLTSTLMGTFFNYSATFENINPLGDPQLSLIDKLEYHELIHLVRIVLPGFNDDLDDFLVDSYPDQESFPDKVYDSSNGSSVSPVFKANVTDIQWKTFTSSSMKTYKQVNVSLISKVKMWFYTRIENTFTRSMNSEEEHLINVVSKSGKVILLDKNAWQTTHISDKFFVHLFDFMESEHSEVDNDEVDNMYILTFGPKNKYSPTIIASLNSENVTKETKVGFIVANVTAKDSDKDNVVFQLRNDSQNHFDIKQINQSTVAVVLRAKITTAVTYDMELVVYDDGIPSKSSSLVIRVVISDGNTDIDNNNSSTTTNPPKSTTSYDPNMSTVTHKINTDKNGSDNTLFWTIPLIIGCIILLVLITVSTLYILRNRGRDTDNAFELSNIR